ncbi:MAG: hypothetical protein LBI12_07550, partial [Treponema sp.]|nr:hypothetical protein [Treponema sp.]
MKHGIFLLLLLISLPLWAQQTVNTTASVSVDQLSYVGMTLQELLGRFGAPRNVIAARGVEPWQDDVIFEYAECDFYIYRDRVWQIRLASAHGISIRDRKAAVL